MDVREYLDSRRWQQVFTEAITSQNLIQIKDKINRCFLLNFYTRGLDILFCFTYNQVRSKINSGFDR